MNTKGKNNMHKVAGFSLIELSLVVMIISMLGLMAYPIYTAHIKTSRRLEAETTLTRVSLALEEYYLQHGSYAGAALEVLKFSSVIAGGVYQLNLRVTEDSYAISATPLQHSDPLCGVLGLNEKNERTSNGNRDVVGCW